MKFLNNEQTILYDEEKREIRFLDDDKDGKNFFIPSNQHWNLFVLLLENEGQECLTTYLENMLKVDPTYDPIKTFICRLRKDLKNKGIPCNGPKENDDNKITILNKKNRTINGIRYGAYTLLLPKIKNKSEKILATLFWQQYEFLSAQKEGKNKNCEVIASLGDVYQFPCIQENGTECKWSIEQKDTFNQNALIEAPNGYGKSTFMRRILLSANYAYIEGLTENQKKQYEKIKNFHGIDGNCFFIYIECKDIDFDRICDLGNVEWMFNTLSRIEGIRLDRFLDIDEFIDLIRNYNLRKKLIVLIDGLDEVSSVHRKILIEKLNAFQHDKDFGFYSRIIMTARPLFWQIELGGYRKYTISNRNIIDNQDIFRSYINGYTKNHRTFDTEKMYLYVRENPYLSEIVCTPAIIVWIIREYQYNNSDIYLSIERIIEQMMLRYNSRELVVYKDHYKRVYEEIAYKYLCLSEDDQGLPFLNTEVLSLVQSCIDAIISEGDKQFNRVFSSDNKNEEELGELFFTNVALMEYVNDRIRFTTLTYAYHLAARHILRCFAKKNCRNIVIQALEEIAIDYRYVVMVMASTLVLHLDDIRFFKGFGPEAKDYRFELVDIFIEYLKQKWNDPNCCVEEKELIQDAIAQILLKYYGDNVFTNRNVSADESCVKWFKHILDIELNENKDAVKKYKEKIR